MIKKEIICDRKDKLLNYITDNFGITYSTANKLLRKKDIRINEKKINENIDVFPFQKITIFLPENLNNKRKYFEKVYEDENILIINKYKNIEVTSPNNISIDKLLNETGKYFALNRLDRNTEGLVIFCKNNYVHKTLKNAMKNNEISKFYLAEIVGIPNFEKKNFISYLCKDKDKSEVKIFEKPIKNSVKIETKVSVLKQSPGNTSIVLVEIHNGKTHQIRAQLSHIGHAIVGDGKYGKNADNKKYKEKTQKLTAYKIKFNLKDINLKYLNEKNFEINPSWIKECPNE